MNKKAHRIGFVALVVSATLGFAMKTSAADRLRVAYSALNPL